MKIISYSETKINLFIIISLFFHLTAKLATWQANDISIGPLYNGSIKKALKSIQAQTILMPCTQDLYFSPKDNAFEAKFIPNAEVRPYESAWGHCVANPGNDHGFEVALDKGIQDLLNVTLK